MRNLTAVERVVLLFCSVSCVRCTLHAQVREPQPTFAISPNPALMDERVTIKIAECPPNRHITVRARSRDQRGYSWSSSAVFRARQDGSIDLSAQVPISGSYAGIDAMGLFWSMQPDKSQRSRSYFFTVIDWFKPVVTEFEAVSDTHVVGAAQSIRYFAGPDVRAEALKRDGMVGILYKPAGGGRHRAIILLGGSEGGFPAPEGAMLASRGFLVLTLAYFGTPDLPASMQRITIEYFGRAIHYLWSSPDVERAAVWIMGASRGAEAALIAASTYPEIQGIVGVSSSNVRWEGATSNMRPGGPAWTYGGNPLPYVPFHIGAGFAVRYVWSAATGSAVALRPMFLDSLARVAGGEMEIPVERIHGPVLLASGGDDRKWPSALMSARAMDRLRRNRHPDADEHVSYEGAGHWIPCAYVPTGGLRGRIAEEIGGTPEASAKAQSAWWPKMLQFLTATNRKRGAS